MGKPLKVSVTLTIVIDDDSDWTTAFGVSGRADIRADVKSYVGSNVQHLGVFGNGEVTAEIDWR